MFPLLLSTTWILECSNADRHRPLNLNAVAIQHFGSILCDLLYQSGFTLTAVILYSKCVFLFNRIFGHTAAHQIFVFCFFFFNSNFPFMLKPQGGLACACQF